MKCFSIMSLFMPLPLIQDLTFKLRTWVLNVTNHALLFICNSVKFDSIPINGNKICDETRSAQTDRWTCDYLMSLFRYIMKSTTDRVPEYPPKPFCWTCVARMVTLPSCYLLTFLYINHWTPAEPEINKTLELYRCLCHNMSDWIM